MSVTGSLRHGTAPAQYVSRAYSLMAQRPLIETSFLLVLSASAPAAHPAQTALKGQVT